MSKTKIDPYGAQCSYCGAEVGFNCTYVHPKFWTSDSKRRFFNNQTTEKQIELLQRTGSPLKTPHFARFRDARKAADEREMAKTVNWARMEPRVMAQMEADDGYQPTLNFGEDLITLHFTGEGRSLLKEAYNKGRDEGQDLGYKNGFKDGVEEGKRVAINLIATGSEDG